MCIKSGRILPRHGQPDGRCIPRCVCNPSSTTYRRVLRRKLPRLQGSWAPWETLVRRDGRLGAWRCLLRPQEVSTRGSRRNSLPRAPPVDLGKGDAGGGATARGFGEGLTSDATGCRLQRSSHDSRLYPNEKIHVLGGKAVGGSAWGRRTLSSLGHHPLLLGHYLLPLTSQVTSSGPALLKHEWLIG